jgi:hypothetical protein
MTKQAIRQVQIRRVRLQPPKVWVADRPLTLDDYLRLMDEEGGLAPTPEVEQHEK